MAHRAVTLNGPLLGCVGGDLRDVGYNLIPRFPFLMRGGCSHNFPSISLLDPFEQSCYAQALGVVEVRSL